MCVFCVCITHIVHTDSDKQEPYATCSYPIICQNEKGFRVYIISLHAGVTRAVTAQIEIEIDAADCSRGRRSKSAFLTGAGKAAQMGSEGRKKFGSSFRGALDAQGYLNGIRYSGVIGA